MPISYAEEFKEAMIRKLLPPNAQSANALADEIGVAATTLCRWRREAESGSVSGMKRKNRNKSKAEKPMSKAISERTRRYSLEEKCQIVLEAAEMPDVELGGYLRAKGLHDSDLERFREEVMRSMGERKSLGRQKTKDKKRIRELEKELKRKEKALAEMAALLVLKKKVQAIWGDEGDDTNGKNG